MTIAVIGATGHIGSEIVRGLVARGESVTALVRNPEEAHRAFGEVGGPCVRRTRLDEPRDLAEAFDGTRAVFIAMGSIGKQVSFSALRSPPSPARPRSNRSPVSQCSTPPPTRSGSTSEHITASTSSPPPPECRTRRSARPSSRCRCSPRHPRYASRVPGQAWPAAAGWP